MMEVNADDQQCLQLSTCCSATCASCGKLCWASLESMKVSGFCGGAIVDCDGACEFIEAVTAGVINECSIDRKATLES